jgi:two-component system phosphate regulon response regulator PhoB
MSAKILLVEDDVGLSTTLLERLKLDGYQPVHAATKKEAEDLFHQSADDFDLLLLDVGLPDGSGLDFARDIRCKYAVPIVFLSAINSAAHRLEGFEIGAEDYIPKPFHLKELLLRIKKALQVNELAKKIDYEFFSIDFEARSIYSEKTAAIYPSARDFDVLKFLISASPRVVSRQELIKRVWQESEDSQSGRTVDNSIVRLRQHMRPFLPEDKEIIRSVRGLGYQWLS